MKIITSTNYAERINPMYCLDNNTVGGSLYNKLEYFTEQVVKYHLFELEQFDGIIIILRAGLPLGLKLYQLTNKPVGFVSAKRRNIYSKEADFEKFKDIPVNPDENAIKELHKKRLEEDYMRIEITYVNIPKFENPLIVDSWIATGNTVKAVCKHLNMKKINLFAVIASKQSLELINPDNYVIGFLTDKLNSLNYIIPPDPYKPRDIGNDLFVKVPDKRFIEKAKKIRK